MSGQKQGVSSTAARPISADMYAATGASNYDISAADLQLFLVTDDIKEALAHIKRHAIEEFGLSPKPPTPSKLLGESAYPIVITDQTP